MVSIGASRAPRDEPLSAQLGQNRERLHCEDSELFAPEIGEIACRAVARYCKSFIKGKFSQKKECTFWLSISLFLPSRIPAVGV